MTDQDETVELAVPKFSSFKSKSAVPAAVDDENKKKRARHSERDKSHDSDHYHDAKRSRHRHESRHRDSDRHRSKSHRERREKRRSRSPSARKEEQPARDHRETTQRVVPVKSDLFFFDTKGDPLIFRYGRLDRSQIPAYYRYGGGRVLGTRGRLVIHREGANDFFSLRMPGEGSPWYNEKDGLRSKNPRLKRNPVLLRPHKRAKPDEDEEDGYLAVGKQSKRQKTEPESEDSGDDHMPSYRSIEGKAKAEKIEDESSEDEDSEEDELPPLEQRNPLKWRSIQLNRQVKDQPTNVAAWLELVDHQDVLLKAGQTLDYDILENEAHSFTEIKVSMLESALSNANDQFDRRRVLHRLMTEGVKVWDGKTAGKKWSEIRSELDDDFELWKLHLDFAMSSIASFQYDEIKQILLDRLHRLTSSLHSDYSENALKQAIYVFLRATAFAHDAGFKELAVAAWQGVLEMTFFRPESFTDQESSAESLGEFWESEVPRIGEPFALGWDSFVNTGNSGDAPEPIRDNKGKPEPSRDAFNAWANVERLLAKDAEKPARTMDEGTEDDPFRVVMYSDIQPFLIYFPNHALKEAETALLNAFLIFCGLPPLPTPDEWAVTTRQDQYLNVSALDKPVEEEHTEPTTDETEIQKRLPRAVSSFQAICTADVLFPGQDWFHYMGSRTDRRRLEYSLVENVVNQVSKRAPSEDLALYSLAKCCMGGTGSTKTIAKGFLKKFPSSSGLYNAYALAELSESRVDVAKKVLASATQLFMDSSDGEGSDLWRTWSWAELVAGNPKLAVKRLCSASDSTVAKAPDNDDAVSPAQILKAHRYYSSNIGYLASNGDAFGAEVQGECLALLSYLTAEGSTEPRSASQGSISAAMSSIESTSIELQVARSKTAEAARERLLQFAARLLFFNASIGPSRRAYIREWLSKFLDHYPRNTIFLSLLEWSDSSLRVVDETRTLLYEKVLVGQADCLSSRVFSIEHEMARGNTNSTKAAFEHAVTSDVCRHNPQVWIAYIRHCYEHKELRTGAKDVFFRALRHCPWSKSVMMEAFGTLIRCMESSELRGVFDTMANKGLRVHFDLESFLVDRKEREGERETETVNRKEKRRREKRRG